MGHIDQSISSTKTYPYVTMIRSTVPCDQVRIIHKNIT